MKRRKILYSGILLSAMFLAGCASGRNPQVLATFADSGEYITLHRGQKLVIELPRSEADYTNWKLIETMGDIMYPPVKQEIQLVTNPVSMVRYVFTPKSIGLGRVYIVEAHTDGEQTQELRTFELIVSITQ